MMTPSTMVSYGSEPATAISTCSEDEGPCSMWGFDAGSWQPDEDAPKGRMGRMPNGGAAGPYVADKVHFKADYLRAGACATPMYVPPVQHQQDLGHHVCTVPHNSTAPQVWSDFQYSGGGGSHGPAKANNNAALANVLLKHSPPPPPQAYGQHAGFAPLKRLPPARAPCSGSLSGHAAHFHGQEELVALPSWPLAAASTPQQQLTPAPYVAPQTRATTTWPPTAQDKLPMLLWCSPTSQGVEQRRRLAPHFRHQKCLHFPTSVKFARWLFEQHRGDINPWAVLVAGWREAKPCLAALSSAFTGLAEELRPDGRRPTLRAPTVGRRPAKQGGLVRIAVSTLLITVESSSAHQAQARARAASWVASVQDSIPGLRIILVLGPDELEDAVHMMRSNAGGHGGLLGSPVAYGGPPGLGAGHFDLGAGDEGEDDGQESLLEYGFPDEGVGRFGSDYHYNGTNPMSNEGATQILHFSV